MRDLVFMFANLWRKQSTQKDAFLNRGMFFTDFKKKRTQGGDSLIDRCAFIT